jgi:hypothetical protein
MLVHKLYLRCLYGQTANIIIHAGQREVTSGFACYSGGLMFEPRQAILAAIFFLFLSISPELLWHEVPILM